MRFFGNHKRNMNTKRIWYVLLIAFIYLALLALLVCAEHTAAVSKIHDLGDALWYSMVTLTTVGYGDIYPVTPVGRFVGIIFAIGSLGILTALISAFVAMLTGHLFPLLILKKLEKQKWYIFNRDNEKARALAMDLLKDDQKAVIIFLETQYSQITQDHLESDEKHSSKEGREYIAWYLPETIEKIVEKHPNVDIHFFCIGKNNLENIKVARNVMSLGIKVYCVTDVGVDMLPPYVTTFQEKNVVARKYWIDHPVTKKDEVILLIGCGKYGEKILEKALLTNVVALDQHISYHVFGNTTHFKLCHPVLTNQPLKDEIHYHSGDWKADVDLLRSADRIIICSDDEVQNLSIELELHRYFAVKADVYIRLSDNFHSGRSDGEGFVNEFCTRFGTAEDIFRKELVIDQRLEQLPYIMNEYYLESNLNEGSSWRHLSDFMQQYYIATADHLIQKIRLLLENKKVKIIQSDLCREAQMYYEICTDEEKLYYRKLEHMRWMRFYIMYNWQFGEVRNGVTRQHPLLRPFNELTEAETKRYEMPWLVFDYVARYLDIRNKRDNGNLI